MKTNLKFTLPLLAVAATSLLYSCSDKDELNLPIDPNAGKEMIALAGDGNIMTRATLAKNGFDSETKILMRITGTNGTSSVYTRTVASAGAKTSDDSHTTANLLGVNASHSDVSFTNIADKRYWDDVYGRDSKLSVYAVAVPNKYRNAKKTGSETEFVLPDTKLSNSGTASGINTDWFTGTEDNTISWGVSENQTVNTQADEDLVYSNNIKSGSEINGRYTWDYTANALKMDKGEMQWIKDPNGTGTTGKFDVGHLVFNHALTWFTIVLTEGEGFNNSGNLDFNFKEGENAQLIGFSTSGKFDVKSGSWSDLAPTIITKLADVSDATKANKTVKKLEAYCLPGRDLSAATSNVLTFSIDGNDYYVTGQTIAAKIQEYYQNMTESSADYDAAMKTKYSSFTTIEKGVHYQINITVGKKQIEAMTAQVVDWEEVQSAEIKPENTYATFTFEERGTYYDNSSKEPFFEIYRAKQTSTTMIDNTTTPNYAWATGYTVGDDKDINNTHVDGSNTVYYADKSYTDSNNLWTTQWYWPDNYTYYHFRAVGDDATSNPEPPTVVEDDADYFTISSGSAYKDFLWGAPFYNVNNDYKFKYSTNNGFAYQSDGTTYQISSAIGVTKSKINMLLFHMTSQLTFIVQTTADNDPDHVALYDATKTVKNTKVEILRFTKDGKVMMGTGQVVPRTTITSEESVGDPTESVVNNNDSETDHQTFFYGICPQPLSRGDANTDKIGLRITTPDGNQYIVSDLSKYTASKITNKNLQNPYTNSVIDYWYPNYQYTYTVTIKKTGIVSITAQLVDWETVKGDLGTITLEN